MKKRGKGETYVFDFEGEESATEPTKPFEISYRARVQAH